MKLEWIFKSFNIRNHQLDRFRRLSLSEPISRNDPWIWKESFGDLSCHVIPWIILHFFSLFTFFFRIPYEVATMTLQARSVTRLSVLVALLLVGSTNAAEPLNDRACPQSAMKCEFSITATLRYTMVFAEPTRKGPKWVPVEARQDGLYTMGAAGDCAGQGHKLSAEGESNMTTKCKTGISVAKLLGLRHFSLYYPNSKVHGGNMGPIWGRQDPGGPHVDPWTLLSGYPKGSGSIQFVVLS